MMAVTLQIHRFLDEKSWIQEYKIEDRKGMTILEALNEIKAKQDATLSFASSCRCSICGACAVRVNGYASLACETVVAEVVKRYNSETIELQPLGNFRVIRDLIVDWDPKYEKMKKIKPCVHPKEEFSAAAGCKQSIADFKKIERYASCILCGSCVSECNKSALNEQEFLDPFTFVKAAKIVEDSRDRDPKEHMKAVVDAGLWRCLNCQECTAKCPKGLDPAGAIEKLKLATFKLKMADSVGSNHAQAFYTDLKDKGMLDESKLAVRTEGIFSSATRVGLALRLMKAGKLDLLASVPENKEIGNIRKIIEITEKEDK